MEQLASIEAAELRRLREAVESLRRASPPALVTVAEAAERLGISERTVRRMVKAGDLPSRRIGRSIRVDLIALRPLDSDEVARLARKARGGHS